MVYAWTLDFSVAFAVLVLLGSMTKTIAIKYSRSRSINLLTLQPYYFLIAFMAGKIIQHSYFLHYGTDFTKPSTHMGSLEGLVI
jgi:hypothetical protein